MKIVHLCLSSFYIDEFGYQENLIPKYNKKDGHEVTIIASTFTYNKTNGEPSTVDVGEYINNDGVKVIRVDYKYNFWGFFNDKIKIFDGTYQLLERENPDIIFCHGIQFLDLYNVTKYVEKHPNCKLIADTHATEANSGKNFISRELLHKIIYKRAIQKSLKNIEKIYAIAPGCKYFAEEMYSIPSSKIEYLFLGADTDEINFENQNKIRNKIRNDLNIAAEDFVVITGGKITKRKNIDALLSAIKKIDKDNIKVIIFGAINTNIKEKLLQKIHQDKRVSFIGWIDSKDVYNYYLASDLAVFPGSKSALWEQAICCGLPLICKEWSGMKYVDVGGNCIFWDNDIEELRMNIESLMEDTKKYESMRSIALTKGYETFSYEIISRKALS
ncbi:Glycosyltransferase involved in cell wall bisynthesis [Bhargavaea beijingensis]|uniref:Glycosyltransferase involved in cell wall bisynthesis n=1 Tax=Bhargavaea beijingensis TaxID=426756 RepID=A0A1G6ZBU6_9BACL|nr:glycosyltransferase family 4 protein [Bhargavaea beijingensis]SDD99335.1 Glycosyltransferase involved in cell wall bisynthesis [Bhargavaea beijingensis]